MKRLITLFLVCMSLLAAVAAPKLTVFKVSGDVTADIDGTVRPLKSRDEVKMQTVVHIPEGAYVTILNHDTKKLFSSVKSGDFKVANIIAEARKQSSAVVYRAGASVLDVMSKGAGGKQTKPQGVAVRGSGSGEISVERIVADALISGRSDSQSPVSFRRKYNADSTYVYEITSKIEDPVYVNIVDCSEPQRRLLFDVDYSQGEPYVLIGPGTTAVDAFEFFGGEEGKYILVATNYPFDVQMVQMMLKSHKASEEGTALPENLKMWLTTGK